MVHAGRNLCSGGAEILWPCCQQNYFQGVRRLRSTNDAHVRRSIVLIMRGHVLEHIREAPADVVELDFADVFFQMSHALGIEGERDSLIGQWETVFLYDDESLMEGDYLASGLRGEITYPVDADIPVAPFLQVAQLVLEVYARFVLSEVRVIFPSRRGIINCQTDLFRRLRDQDRKVREPFPEPSKGEARDFSLLIRTIDSDQVKEPKEELVLFDKPMPRSEWSLRAIGSLCSSMIDDYLPYIYGGKNVEFLFRKENQ